MKKEPMAKARKEHGLRTGRSAGERARLPKHEVGKPMTEVTEKELDYVVGGEDPFGPPPPTRKTAP